MERRPLPPISKYSCTITIEGADAKIDGTFPLETVVDATSYFQPGYQYTSRYRCHHWDGRIKLFKKVSRTFPAGLTNDVVEALRQQHVRVMVDDQRNCPGSVVLDPGAMNLKNIKFDHPYDYQPECAKAMINGQRGIVAVATNGGKTIIAVLAIKMLKLPSLFMVPGKDLLYQTHRVFEKTLDMPVGLVGDAHWSPNPLMTVATVDTLFSRLAHPQCRDFLNTINVIFADECHHVGSDSWYQVMRACPAYYRFGLSGTPLKRSDGADLRLVGATGPVLYEVKNKILIERGISVGATILFLKITKPAIPKGTQYKEVYRLGIVENPYRNQELCKHIAEFVENGLSVLVLVKEISHGDILDKKLWSYPKKSFIPHQFINGTEPSDVRRKALEEFRSGTVKVLIATSILDEGVDVPNIDVLALAGGGKSSIKTLQRLGRGLRKGGNVDQLYVLETADFQHSYLLKHSLQRLEDYQAEDCFTIQEVQ